MVKTNNLSKHLSGKTFFIILLLITPLESIQAATQTGTVKSAHKPLAHAEVTLYQAGVGLPGMNSKATKLGSAQSDDFGRFEIVYDAPQNIDAVLYLIADVEHGYSRLFYWFPYLKNWFSKFYSSPANPHKKTDIRLATMLGAQPVTSNVIINERSTVAVAFAMAQFINDADISGKHPGLKNAAAMSQSLVNISNGEVSEVLSSAPNGIQTTTWPEFNSLANMIARCVKSSYQCKKLFKLSKPNHQGLPKNTLQAMSDIAHFPANNVRKLFNFSYWRPTYKPALNLQNIPDAWTIALRFTDHNNLLDGPGNIAFDQDGNAWVINNYVRSIDLSQVCGDNHLYAFKPDGSDLPGSPFGGDGIDGGLYGAGFGITFDTQNTLWAGNFGFQGSMCDMSDQNKQDLSSSVSQFDSSGFELSPATPALPPFDGGWRSPIANIKQPQGTVSDKDDTIWVANCGGHSITGIVNGDISDPDSQEYEPVDNDGNPIMSSIFDVAVDTEGNIWASSNGNDRVVGFRPNGEVFDIIENPTPTSDDNQVINLPMGLATDQAGNVWIANSASAHPPCLNLTDADRISEDDAISETAIEGANAAVYLPDGSLHEFTGGGIFMPWGIAVDGDNNVWVANFGGPHSGLIGIVHLCGATPSNCLPGMKMGDPFSPETGYTSNGLTRNTGIQIDPSGNVWLANNWKINALNFLENPGEHHVVVFLGLASPVKAPLIGPPEKP